MKLIGLYVALTLALGGVVSEGLQDISNKRAVVEDLPKDVKFTEIDYEAGKEKSKLGVSAIEDEDNDPTPGHAKKPLKPYESEIDMEAGIPNLESATDDEDQQQHPYDSFVMSVSMIIVSEIGDKTFLIAALMAMKHSRVLVFFAAFSSLAIMTVLSGVVGHTLPTLISKRLTQFLASVLFIVFGAKLLNEGLSMSKDVGVDEELAEVEEEIQMKDINGTMNDAEAGVGSSSSSGHGSQGHFTPKKKSSTLDQLKDLANFVFSPIFIQVFVMTFLGEWGDRSQIATIALAAGSDYWFVIIGAILGHGVCTCAACVGGKLLAKKISMRNVTLGGAIAFFVFAILYFYNAYYDLD